MSVLPSEHGDTLLSTHSLGYLVLYDDSVGFRGFFPVKQDSVFEWSSSQRLAGNSPWNCQYQHKYGAILVYERRNGNTDI